MDAGKFEQMGEKAFPQPQSCGPIEGSNTVPSGLYYHEAFPQPQSCGPIEG